MLLVGTPALALNVPDLARPDEEREIWLGDEDVVDGSLRACRFEEDSDGELCARFASGKRRYRLRHLPGDDPRRAFLVANRDRPLLDDGPGWPVRVASPASVALIWRARLYLRSGWHRRFEDYHCLLGRLGEPLGKPGERQAYEATRASVLARGDGKQAYGPRQAFEQLSHAQRIRVVREECYALALERVVIPAGDLGERCDSDFVEDYRRALREGILQRKQLPRAETERRDWLRGYWNQLIEKDLDAAMAASAQG
jgi:hypothetical protein